MKVIRTIEEDIDRYIASLRGASPPELGLLLAIATDSRHAMEKNSDGALQLLDPRGSEARDHFIGSKISRLIVSAQKIDPAYAAGMIVWLHSFRAALTPEVRYKGQEMWVLLLRGASHVEEAAYDYSLLTGRRLSIDGFDQIPSGLEILT